MILTPENIVEKAFAAHQEYKTMHIKTPTVLWINWNTYHIFEAAKDKLTGLATLKNGKLTNFCDMYLGIDPIMGDDCFVFRRDL